VFFQKAGIAFLLILEMIYKIGVIAVVSKTQLLVQIVKT